MLFAIALSIFIIIVAMNWFFGMWNCLISLINFFIAAMVASSSYELLAWELERAAPSYSMVVDFVSVWLIFVLTFLFLRGGTDLLSRYRLKVHPAMEIVGRSVFSIWLAGGFICFTFFTFHLAPLPPNTFQDVGDQRVLGIGPDRFWLAFMQSRSRGALSEAKNAPFLPPYTLLDHPEDVDKNARVFDPGSDFITLNFWRRRRLSQQDYLRISNKR